MKLPPLSRGAKIVGLSLLLLLVLGNLVLFARAGGAGGSSGSSGFSSGGSSNDGAFIFALIFQLIRIIGPIPTLVIVLIGLLIFRLQTRAQHQRTNTVHQTRRVSAESSGPPASVKEFLKQNPDFSLPEFEGRVRKAFFDIQEAWQKKSMDPVRRYVSDALYQRFTTQFLMMNLLEQTNELSNIRIQRIWLQKAEREGDIQTLDVGIQATLTDRFVCKTNPSLNSGGTETFTEYWSFLRKGKKSSTADYTRDMYHSNDCPSCSAPLPEDLGERGQCPYCRTVVNTGEFDWVLSEITQVEDYGASMALENRASGGGRRKAQEVLSAIPGQSVQSIEDQASNAYLQILSAIVRKEPQGMRRFTGDTLYTSLEKAIPPGNVVYNRLFLNHATLLSAGMAESENKIRASVAIKMTYQRVELTNKRTQLIDRALYTKSEVLTLERALPQGQVSKGSLLMHQCPACGAGIQDSLDTACPYCSTVYTGGTHDWVAIELVPLSDFARPKTESSARIVKPKHFDQLYDVKDYALVNMMVVLAADGLYSDEEREFAREVAKSLGFNPEGLESLFAQASAGRLGIRMPHQVAKRGSIFKLMEQAARADGRIDPAEQAILDEVRKSYMF